MKISCSVEQGILGFALSITGQTNPQVSLLQLERTVDIPLTT